MHDPGDEHVGDGAPSLPPAPASAARHPEAVDRLLVLAERLADASRWCLSLARELAAGRVPDWPAERARRKADLERRLVDLAQTVARGWP